MKAYLLYRLAYVIIALLLSSQASHYLGLQHGSNATEKEAIKLSAREYTIEKLKRYTTMLEIAPSEMIVNDLGDDHYSVLTPVKMAFNSEFNKVWYEVKLHFNNGNVKEMVIDSFKRISDINIRSFE